MDIQCIYVWHIIIIDSSIHAQDIIYMVCICSYFISMVCIQLYVRLKTPIYLATVPVYSSTLSITAVCISCLLLFAMAVVFIVAPGEQSIPYTLFCV